MNFTKEQNEEFEKVTRPLIKFLNDNCHPHITVVIDCISAELSEGVSAFTTEDYLHDKELIYSEMPSDYCGKLEASK